MRDFSAIKTPNGFEVVYYYFIRFGFRSLFVILFFHWIFTGSLPSLKFWIFSPLVFYLADIIIFPTARIVYRVSIDHEKEQIIAYHFFRRKKKTIIPFRKLNFGFFHKTLPSKADVDWIILLGKNPFPIVGQIYSHNKYSCWSKLEMEKLSNELINIGLNFETWTKAPPSGKRYFPKRGGIMKVQELINTSK